MDFIVSYHLYNKIIKKQKDNYNKELENIKEKEEKQPIYQSCNQCGQYIYSCQCENIKLIYFNPEKSIY